MLETLYACDNDSCPLTVDCARVWRQCLNTDSNGHLFSPVPVILGSSLRRWGHPSLPMFRYIRGGGHVVMDTDWIHLHGYRTSQKWCCCHVNFAVYAKKLSHWLVSESENFVRMYVLFQSHLTSHNLVYTLSAYCCHYYSGDTNSQRCQNVDVEYLMVTKMRKKLCSFGMR